MSILKRKKSIYSSNLIGLEFKQSSSGTTKYTIEEDNKKREDFVSITWDDLNNEKGTACFKKVFVEQYFSSGVWVKI